jgi:hypothetical protein
MKTSSHPTARTAKLAKPAQRRLEALLRAMPHDPQDVFSDREEDAVEYDSIVRDFANACDEALSAARYN